MPQQPLTSGQLRDLADKMRNNPDLAEGVTLFDEAATHVDMHAAHGARDTYNWQGLLSYVIANQQAIWQPQGDGTAPKAAQPLSPPLEAAQAVHDTVESQQKKESEKPPVAPSHEPVHAPKSAKS